MAEFKKLSDVNVIESMKEGLNVLVEDGGEIVKLAAESLVPEGGGSGGNIMVVRVIVNAPEGYDGAGECEGTMDASWEDLSKAIAANKALFAAVRIVLPDGSIHNTVQMAEYECMYMEGEVSIVSFKTYEHWREATNDGVSVHHNIHGCDLMPHHPTNPQSPPCALYYYEDMD